MKTIHAIIVIAVLLSVLLCACHQETQAPSSDASVSAETDAVTSSTTAATATSATTLSTTVTTTTTASLTTTTAKSITKRKTTTTSPAKTTEVPIKPIGNGIYEVEISPIRFHYDSTDYTIFYELITQYCGKTITDEFDVWCHKWAMHTDPDTGGTVYTAYDLVFYTKINGCRSTEQFRFSFEQKGDTYVCEDITFEKPNYDPTKVKPPRKPTAKEEKVALKSEKKRVLEKLKKELPGLTFVITDQEVEYHYDIEKDRNYFVVITSYTDLEDEGWNSRERAQFEIER